MREHQIGRETDTGALQKYDHLVFIRICEQTLKYTLHADFCECLMEPGWFLDLSAPDNNKQGFIVTHF